MSSGRTVQVQALFPRPVHMGTSLPAQAWQIRMTVTDPSSLSAVFLIENVDDAYSTVTVLTLEPLNAVFASCSQLGRTCKQSPSIVASRP